MGPTRFLLILASLVPAQQPATDFEQNFRGARPLHASLSLFGPDADEFVKPEAEGLRITLPLEGRQTFGWGVIGDFALSGDFEVTAEFELLALDTPVRGGGAVVALNLAPDHQRTKWAKIGRVLYADGRAGFVAECWTKQNSPEDGHQRFVPMDARTGKLRLERKGSILRFLAAGPDEVFQELLQVDFGGEDMEMVRFVANNNRSPTTVDARLLELKIHSGKLIAAPGLDTSEAGLVAGLGGVLAIMLAILVVLWLRRRHGDKVGTSASCVRPGGK